MRKPLSIALYLVLVSPIIPIALLCWLFEKLENSNVLNSWELRARKLARKVTGV